jgi:hypothetical protein
MSPDHAAGRVRRRRSLRTPPHHQVPAKPRCSYLLQEYRDTRGSTADTLNPAMRQVGTLRQPHQLN